MTYGKVSYCVNICLSHVLLSTDTSRDLDDISVPTTTERDIVLENAILFNRDALVMREFNDAIKMGDSGRVALSLKTLALFYRGSGRVKYAYESIVAIHNFTHVWPKPLRYVLVVSLT